jgi:hypothetical protein
MPSVAPTFNDGQTVDITVQNAAQEAVGFVCVANIAALRALATSSYNKAAAVNDDGSESLRIYRWNSTSTDADDGAAVIAPSDGGTGRWILQL